MTTGSEVVRVAEVIVLGDMGGRASTPSYFNAKEDRGVLRGFLSSCIFEVGEDALRLNKYDRGASIFEGRGPSLVPYSTRWRRCEARRKPATYYLMETRGWPRFNQANSRPVWFSHAVPSRCLWTEDSLVIIDRVPSRALVLLAAPSLRAADCAAALSVVNRQLIAC